MPMPEHHRPLPAPARPDCCGQGPSGRLSASSRHRRTTTDTPCRVEVPTSWPPRKRPVPGRRKPPVSPRHPPPSPNAPWHQARPAPPPGPRRTAEPGGLIPSVLSALVLPYRGPRQRGHGGHTRGQRPPDQPPSTPFLAAYALQRCGTGRHLPHGGDALQDLLAHDGARAHRGGRGQTSGSGRELGDLLLAGVAIGRVTLEGGTFLTVQRIYAVGAGQRVQIARCHTVTPGSRGAG